MSWVDKALATLEQQTRLRQLLPLEPVSPVRVRIDGRETVLFSSNDYLGLSQHPRVREATAQAALERGMGNRGSALICGYSDWHRALEDELADLKAAEDALLFPTGFAANLGLLSALASPETVFFSDALNHASIIDGCRLSRCPVRIYRHGDVDHLESLLRAESATRKVIVSDSLFSMDGDVAPLKELAELKVRFGAQLVLDEAHATLILGKRGGGLAEAVGVQEVVDFQVGTLSKAVGALGGFVACSSKHRSWLLNTARSFIFSTALPAPVVAAARMALEVHRHDPGLQARLWERIEQLGLAMGCELQGPIAPVLLGAEQRALDASRALMERGFHVNPIRPPTVPEGTSRLRIALCSEHLPSDIESLCFELGSLGFSVNTTA